MTYDWWPVGRGKVRIIQCTSLVGRYVGKGPRLDALITNAKKEACSSVAHTRLHKKLLSRTTSLARQIPCCHSKGIDMANGLPVLSECKCT